MCEKCEGLGLVFEVEKTEDWYGVGVYWSEGVRESYCDCEAGDWQREQTEVALRVARELREQEDAVCRALGFESIPF
jgi:hypothetical protein